MKKLLVKILRLPFMVWLTHSLLGNITLFVLSWVILFYPYMAVLIYSEGDLTVYRAFYLLGLSIFAGIFVGTIAWFGATRAFIKRLERKRKQLGKP